jgi:hypothetical protein
VPLNHEMRAEELMRRGHDESVQLFWTAAHGNRRRAGCAPVLRDMTTCRTYPDRR